MVSTVSNRKTRSFTEIKAQAPFIYKKKYYNFIIGLFFYVVLIKLRGYPPALIIAAKNKPTFSPCAAASHSPRGPGQNGRSPPRSTRNYHRNTSGSSVQPVNCFGNHLQMLINVTATEGIPVVTGSILRDIDWPLQKAVKSCGTPGLTLRTNLPTEIIFGASARRHRTGKRWCGYNN